MVTNDKKGSLFVSLKKNTFDGQQDRKKIFFILKTSAHPVKLLRMIQS